MPGSARYNTISGGGEDPKKPSSGKPGREHEQKQEQIRSRNHARNVAKKARQEAASERRREELEAQNQESDRDLTNSESELDGTELVQEQCFSQSRSKSTRPKARHPGVR